VIDLKEQTIKYKCDEDCIDNFGQNDLCEINTELQSASEKESEHIDIHAVEKIRDGYEDNGHLHILVKEDMAEIAGPVADQQINECMKTESPAVKEVNQKTAEKSYNKPLFLPLHKSQGDCQEQKQIR
jgi:hypothetical protein